MKGSAAKIQMTSLDDLFGGATPQAASDQIQEIPLAELHTFKDHPFHVVDDEKMREMAESVAQYGVLVPGIVRPRPEGGYELVAGHRRKRASELAGKETMPVIVRELDEDEAVLMSQARDILAQQAGGKSGMAVTRYIALTKLIEPFLQYVDEGKISVSCAVDYLSTLSENQQWDVKLVMTSTGLFPTPRQMVELKKYSGTDGWNAEGVNEILKVQGNGKIQETLKSKRLPMWITSLRKEAKEIQWHFTQNAPKGRLGCKFQRFV